MAQSRRRPVRQQSGAAAEQFSRQRRQYALRDGPPYSGLTPTSRISFAHLAVSALI
jgi:hypothetical protein